MEKEIHVSNEEVEEFKGYFTPWGFLDVKAAIKTIKTYNLDIEEIQEQIESDIEDLGFKTKDVDINYILYEHILQMARNKISEVLNYDFLNDSKHDQTEIYTYGNYCCTSYDYSNEAIEELKQILNKATKQQKEQLQEDKYYNAFIDLLELEVEE